MQVHLQLLEIWAAILAPKASMLLGWGTQHPCKSIPVAQRV